MECDLMDGRFRTALEIPESSVLRVPIGDLHLRPIAVFDRLVLWTAHGLMCDARNAACTLQHQSLGPFAFERSYPRASSTVSNWLKMFRLDRRGLFSRWVFLVEIVPDTGRSAMAFLRREALSKVDAQGTQSPMQLGLHQGKKASSLCFRCHSSTPWHGWMRSS